MASSVTCDQCGKTEPVYRTRQWISVRQLDDVVIVDFDGSHRPPSRRLAGDYCSAECLSDVVSRFLAAKAS